MNIQTLCDTLERHGWEVMSCEVQRNRPFKTAQEGRQTSLSVQAIPGERQRIDGYFFLLEVRILNDMRLQAFTDAEALTFDTISSITLKREKLEWKNNPSVSCSHARTWKNVSVANDDAFEHLLSNIGKNILSAEEHLLAQVFSLLGDMLSLVTGVRWTYDTHTEAGA